MAGYVREAKMMYMSLMDKRDPRTKDWFLVSSPWPTVFIVSVYVLFSVQGRRIMRDRKPVQFGKFLVYYNFSMVALSVYMLVEFCMSGWLAGYSFGCQPVDYSNSQQAMRMACVSWVNFISKLIELTDTVLIILRKKFNQVSFLHVYHHAFMPIVMCLGVQFVPGGLGTFQSTVNSFIHAMMYTYYGLAALGPAYQKYLWWKKYMTKLQILQFVVVFSHSAQFFFTDCDYPMLFVIIINSGALTFLVFFANFYIKAYLQKSKDRSKDSQVNSNNHISNGHVKTS